MPAVFHACHVCNFKKVMFQLGGVFNSYSYSYTCVENMFDYNYICDFIDSDVFLNYD